MTRALLHAARNAAPRFSALLLLATVLAPAIALTGCYTQLKSSGDRYGYTGRYHEPKPVYSDTIRKPAPQQTAAPQEAPKPLAKTEVTYDTVMKGDTMFINERTREDYTQTETQPINSGETIINNYYGGYEPYDDYWWHPGRPRVVVAVTFGYPYSYWYPHHYWHSYYSPWYDYGYYPSWWYGSYAYYDPWYDPWFGYGFYPPLYDCYSPYYGYGGYYGRHHGYNGYGYGSGYYAGIQGGRVPNYGRFHTGEKHGLVAGGNGVTAPNSAPRLASPTHVVTSNPQVVNQGQVVARDVPVHNTVPGRDGTIRVAQPNTNVVERSGAQVTTEATARRTDIADVENANARVISTTVVSTPEKRVVVVRRRVSAPSGSYAPNTQGNVYRQPASTPRAQGNANTNATPQYQAPREAPRAESGRSEETHVSRGEAQAAPRSEGRTESRGESRGGGEDRGSSNDGPRRSR